MSIVTKGERVRAILAGIGINCIEVDINGQVWHQIEGTRLAIGDYVVAPVLSLRRAKMPRLAVIGDPLEAALRIQAWIAPGR